MMQEDYILGAMPSLRTNKDFPILCESAETYEHVFRPKEIEELLNRIRYDQRGSGSCVGQALVKLKSILEYLQNKETYQFSGWFAWMNRPNNLSLLFETEGANLKDQAEKIVEDGVCFLSQYNLNPENTPNLVSFKKNKDEFYSRVRPTLLESSKAYKADRYVFAETRQEVKHAIRNFGGIAVNIPIYKGFYNVGKDGIVPNPKHGEDSLGYHAAILYGWDDTKKVWYGDNSYGDDWGNSGFFEISYNYPVVEFIALADDSRLHWADVFFYYLWKKGITLHERGFNKDVTRGEVMAMLARLVAGGDGRVTRIPNSTHWAERYFMYLNRNGVKLFEERYDDSVTRGEFMTLLYRTLNKNDSKDVLTKSDERHWAEAYYNALTKNFKLVIYDTRFDENITRGEAMALIARGLGCQK